MPALAEVTCPPVVVLRIAPLVMPDTQRFVELAVVAEIIVVEANGMESPVPAGAAKLIVRADPTSAPEPESEIAVPATGDDVATD